MAKIIDPTITAEGMREFAKTTVGQAVQNLKLEDHPGAHFRLGSAQIFIAAEQCATMKEQNEILIRIARALEKATGTGPSNLITKPTD